jgi:hypothetical protein
MEILFAVLIGTLLLEFVMSGTWWAGYFRYGLPLFVKTVGTVEVDHISAEWLTEHYAHSSLAPLLFKRLSNSEIAFRESMMPRLMHYTPLMHGIIRFDSASRRTVVVGYANWTVMVLFVIFIAADFSKSVDKGVNWSLAIFLLGLYVALYVIQFRRFRRVAKLITERCNWRFSRPEV